MNGMYTLDERGDPVPCEDVIEWGRWFETANRQVALDEIDGVRVSTVFLGVDHSFGRGLPRLWETLVFGGPLDGEGDRYGTVGDALLGHATILARVFAAREVRR